VLTKRRLSDKAMSFPLRTIVAVLGASWRWLTPQAKPLLRQRTGPLRLETKIPLGEVRGPHRSHGG
jgi:hypothetical protein